MKKFILLALLPALFACQTRPALAPPAPLPQASLQKATVAADSVSLMSFNAENLFDTEHDADKDDWTFLPAAKKSAPEVKKACRDMNNKFYRKQCRNFDWSEEVVAAKLRNVAEVVTQVNGGLGPDVLVLVEIENEKILKRLNDLMPQADYRTQVLIEGNDPRGIDVAVLSRLPLAGEARLHAIPWNFRRSEDRRRMHELRGTLEVPLKLPDGKTLTVLANHFPAQGNPRDYRVQQTAFLTKLLKEKENTPVVAAGDFNITAEEDKETGLVSREIAGVASVSHLIGCKTCRGTHNYRGSWSFLDMLIFSKDLDPAKTKGWSVDPQSIEIPQGVANHLFQDDKPRRFDEEDGTGVSDHFPIFARLKLKK